MLWITFEAEATDFLLSDFEAWHLVLANHYIADDEQDWDSFYAHDGDSGQAEITASWNKIFDLKQYAPDWDSKPDQRTIQATLWEIKLSQVKKTEHFIAK